MSATLDAPAAITALVLLEMGVGGLVLTWLAPTFGAVRRGYELLLGSSVLLMIWAARAAIATPLDLLREADDATAAMRTAADRFELVVLVALVVGAVALAGRAAGLELPARLLGVAASLVGVASFVPLAQLQVALNDGVLWLGVLEIALGAVLLGGVWAGMILGHWYLVERRLSNRYMVWIAWLNVGAVGAGLAAILLSLNHAAPEFGRFSPLLSIGNTTLMLGLGTLALVALIAGFNVKLANEGGRSIQASTGMFYLAVILAPAAEFAAKVRYF